MAKSGLMLGLGETENEIKKTLLDLKYAGCMLLTLGQYLAPSQNHVPVARYVPPEEFEIWAETARGMGFTSVAAGPLVRSSYRAEEMMDASQSASGNHQIRKVS
jgi:lipoic acid synthetase